MNKVIAAIAFAAHKHRDQRRKDGSASPFINHHIALVNVLANEAGIDDERVLIAAALQDTIAYAQTSEQEVAREFGQEITGIVLELSHGKLLPKAKRVRWQVEQAATLSRRARLVMLADAICNLRSVASNPPPDWSLPRRQQYFDVVKASVAGLRGVHPALEHIFDETCKLKPAE